MLIRNNTTSPHLVPEAPGSAKNVMIWPGVNDVDPDFWAVLVEKDIIFQHYLETGAMEELEAAGPGRMKEIAALKLVKDTALDELLAKWERGEKRPKVLKAIKEQRAKLVMTPPNPDKADGAEK